MGQGHMLAAITSLSHSWRHQLVFLCTQALHTAHMKPELRAAWAVTGLVCTNVNEHLCIVGRVHVYNVCARRCLQECACIFGSVCVCAYVFECVYVRACVHT